jgi:nucleotide-binding universal stress UspA family protein
VAPESGRGHARALLEAASDVHAAVVLVGSRGRGAVASTVLGSVASGLVNAAARPVLMIPGPASP